MDAPRAAHCAKWFFRCFPQGCSSPWPVAGASAYKDLRECVVRHAELLGFTARSNNGQEGCGRDLSWLYLHPTLPSAELWLQLSMSEAGVTNLGGSVDVKAATSSRDLCHVRAVAAQLMACVAAAYQPCASGRGSLLRTSGGGGGSPQIVGTWLTFKL